MRANEFSKHGAEESAQQKIDESISKWSLPQTTGAIRYPSDVQVGREPLWDFQEIAHKLNITFNQLKQLAFRAPGGFPEAVSGIKSSHGSTKYYKQGEVKKWVRDNQIRELVLSKQTAPAQVDEEQFCENCGGSLAESGKASRALCKSSRSNADLGVSQLASCKAQGLRARETPKKHTIGNKHQSIKGKMVKGHKYGGPLPYNKSDK